MGRRLLPDQTPHFARIPTALPAAGIIQQSDRKRCTCVLPRLPSRLSSWNDDRDKSKRITNLFTFSGAARDAKHTCCRLFYYREDSKLRQIHDREIRTFVTCKCARNEDTTVTSSRSQHERDMIFTFFSGSRCKAVMRIQEHPTILYIKDQHAI